MDYNIAFNENITAERYESHMRETKRDVGIIAEIINSVVDALSLYEGLDTRQTMINRNAQMQSALRSLDGRMGDLRLNSRA